MTTKFKKGDIVRHIASGIKFRVEGVNALPLGSYYQLRPIDGMHGLAGVPKDHVEAKYFEQVYEAVKP